MQKVALRHAQMFLFAGSRMKKKIITTIIIVISFLLILTVVSSHM